MSGGVGAWFNNAVTSLTGKTPGDHVDAVKSAFGVPPGVGTDAGVASALGTRVDARGSYTMTGGRRFKKTGRRGKKVRKTRRGRR